MARKTRKQLVTKDEDRERDEREEGYRRLIIELKREWRENDYSPAPSR